MHEDGWRSRIVEDQSGRAVELILLIDGSIKNKQVLRSFPPAADNIPTARRAEKLLQSLARYINEGGSALALQEQVTAFVEHVTATAAGPTIYSPYELVSVESDETHVRIFRLPSGNYIRIIEDECAELLTPEELLAASDDEEYVV